MATNVAEVIHDITQLAELQLKLLAVDANAVIRRATLPAVGAVMGITLVLGSMPVALLAGAYALNTHFDFSLPVALAMSAGIGVLLGAILTIVGWVQLRGAVRELERSQIELQRNVAWVKRTLRGNSGSSS